MYLDVATLERKAEALTYLDVATLERKAEASLFVLDEVQRHLGVAFLLEVGNDALANQLSITHHVQHLIQQNSKNAKCVGRSDLCRS